MPVVPFTPGFSDFFPSLARPGSVFANQSDINQMFARLQDYNARTIRFAVYWDEVEHTQGQFDWSNYSDLALQAYYGGFKLLPQIWSAPSWLGSNRVQINGGGLYYPTEAAHTAFGNFAAETMSFFSGLGVSRAIEIWNEPNINKYAVPVATYKSMLNASLAAINARTYGVTPTVVSAGLAMGGAQSGWLAYLQGFMAQCYPYAVGIHPYDVTNYSGYYQAAAVSSFVDNVKAKYQVIADTVTTDIWITEFGCPSSAPFLEAGKASALEQLVGSSGYFASRSRCKAAILYRFLPQGLLHDDAPSSFDTYPVLSMSAPTTFSENQPTQTMLAANWAGAPS